MERLSNDLERHIINFIDFGTYTLKEYVIKKEHENRYKNTLIYFNNELLNEFLFSKFTDDIKSKLVKNKSFHCSFKIDKKGNILKGDGNYKRHGIDFVIYNKQFILKILPDIIMDYWLYNNKQKTKIWILSKTLPIYP